MRSLKSTTATTTTLKGKRKLAQTKDYPDSPPATPPPPPQNNVKTRALKSKINDVNSPPSKRRRSSDRIANKLGKKRQSMEDDDGFVFTRPAKQKRKPAVPEEPPQRAKPFVMDFTVDVICLAEEIKLIHRHLARVTHFNHLVNRNGLHLLMSRQELKIRISRYQSLILRLFDVIRV